MIPELYALRDGTVVTEKVFAQALADKGLEVKTDETLKCKYVNVTIRQDELGNIIQEPDINLEEEELRQVLNSLESSNFYSIGGTLDATNDTQYPRNRKSRRKKTHSRTVAKENQRLRRKGSSKKNRKRRNK
jgi:hypothetical protein